MSIILSEEREAIKIGLYGFDPPGKSQYFGVLSKLGASGALTPLLPPFLAKGDRVLRTMRWPSNVQSINWKWDRDIQEDNSCDRVNPFEKDKG